MSTARRTIYVSSRKSPLAMVQTVEVIGMLKVRKVSTSLRLKVTGLDEKLRKSVQHVMDAFDASLLGVWVSRSFTRRSTL
jgi:porphobilinogen deaminase